MLTLSPDSDRSSTVFQVSDCTWNRTSIGDTKLCSVSRQAAIRSDEIAQIQYEIDKLTKQKLLLELRFPTAPEDPVVAREFANETIRIQAVVTQLQARLAQLNAERAFEQASRDT